MWRCGLSFCPWNNILSHFGTELAPSSKPHKLLTLFLDYRSTLSIRRLLLTSRGRHRNRAARSPISGSGIALKNVGLRAEISRARDLRAQPDVNPIYEFFEGNASPIGMEICGLSPVGMDFFGPNADSCLQEADQKNFAELADMLHLICEYKGRWVRATSFQPKIFRNSDLRIK